MNIIIDIGHPGHVHYFKNLYFELKDKGYNFLFIARNKKVIHSLLNNYGISFIDRGKGKDSSFGKLIYMFSTDIFLFKHFIDFKPDISLSFSSPYLAQVSWLFRVPHIALNDTEHSDSVHKKFTYPFSKVIITPSSYQHQLGLKHLTFNSIVEALYLHPSRFSPSEDIFDILNIGKNQQFAILRFVSWNAFHDVGESGLSLSEKRDLIKFLSTKMKVFISSEGELPKEFMKYQISIPPEKMHDALSFATIFVGESGTMASEAAFLGTPVYYINSLPLMCYLKLEKEAGILKHFKNGNDVLDRLQEVNSFKTLKNEAIEIASALKSKFIDPNVFLKWFVLNYPMSVILLKENPDYQYKIS